MIKAFIDGHVVGARKGSTILQAAQDAGITVPTLCYLAHYNAIGSCRVCVVEVEGLNAPVSACNTPLESGMNITTQSSVLNEYRRMALELLLAEHGPVTPERCAQCAFDGDCQLQKLCDEYGVTGQDAQEAHDTKKKQDPIVDSNPFLRYDAGLCIRCQRCVGACNNGARNHVLQTAKRGTQTLIMTPFGPNWKQSTCESCGNCAQACPTGALAVKRRLSYRACEVNTVRTTCPHCGVGCQLDLVVKDGKVVDARGADGPSNNSLLCVKGRSGSFDFITAPERLTSPLIKNPETGEFRKASWDEALDLVATTFTKIKNEQGGSSLAAFACSRSTNEDIYLLQKMGRTVFDTNNVDNCARV